MAEPMRLTFAGDPFEIIRQLEDGHIVPEGLTLDFQPEMTNPVRHGAMVRDLAFDICELNVCTYLIAKERGVPITALPIFLFRKFRHGNIFVHADSGLSQPVDLVGRKIAVPNLQPASNVWLNGIFNDHYGVSHKDITWMVERDEDVAFDYPPDVRIERVPAGKTAVDLLLAGEVAGVMSPMTPPAMLKKGERRIRRLWTDYVKREQDYFRETGLFPIMHVTAVKTEVLENHPWIADSLMTAFEASKQAAYKHFSNVRVAPLAWYGAQWEEERALFADDPWAYGLGETNRRNLETIIRYTHEQGLIQRRPELGELFFKA